MQVHTNNAMSFLRQTGRSDSTNVAKTKDRNVHVRANAARVGK